MTSYVRTPAQTVAIRRMVGEGYAVTVERNSKVEMRKGGQVVVVLSNGSVRRGESGYQKVVKRGEPGRAW